MGKLVTLITTCFILVALIDTDKYSWTIPSIAKAFNVIAQEPDAATRGVLLKNSQENTYARVSFLIKLPVLGLLLY